MFRSRRPDPPARSRHARLAAVLLIGAVVLGALVRVAGMSRPADVPVDVPATWDQVPAVSSVTVILFENRGPGDIFGSGQAPTFEALAAAYGSATNAVGVARPSQPNYLALFSGSTHGVTDNENHEIDAPTLADQLEAAGHTWRMHAENFPGDCFLAAEATDGPDGPGLYARKHVPALSFRSITRDPGRCANVRPLREFTPHAADVTFVIPNACHSMHDCSVADGDAWLAGFLPRILDDPAWGDDRLLVITFDEGVRDDQENRIPLLVVSPLVAPGTRSDVRYPLTSVLATIQAAFDLGCLADSCTAPTLGAFFRP